MAEQKTAKSKPATEPVVESQDEDTSGLVCDCRECKGARAHPHKR